MKLFVLNIYWTKIEHSFWLENFVPAKSKKMGLMVDFNSETY